MPFLLTLVLCRNDATLSYWLVSFCKAKRQVTASLTLFPFVSKTFPMRLILLLLLPGLLATACSSSTEMKTLSSPDGKVVVRHFLNDQGQFFYTVSRSGEQVIDTSALGLVLESADLSRGLAIESVTEMESVSDSYTLLNGKQKECSYEANRQEVRFVAKNGLQLLVVFQVSNDGAAFRYRVEGDVAGTQHITEELTTFVVGGSARGWLHPHAEAQTGWSNTQPSYEEYYEKGIPAGTPSTLGQGWSFPALFQKEGNWLLISETDMSKEYCGSHLGHESIGGKYQLVFPQDPERTGPEAPLFPAAELPLESPWRMIVLGDNLGTIVESTLASDLARPAVFEDTDWIKPGHASWSWVLLKDDSTVFPVQKQFVDYAAEMGWEYCLIDAQWDTQIGYEKIAELSQYAQSKGVGLILWYNSNGSWNEAPQTPRNRMHTAEVRREEFARLQDMGIKGLKIDFFGGDGQSFMAYYQDILEDAADYGLLINYHGATIPRGWYRSYPNLMTMESVRGMEFVTFEQANADQAPTHCAVLPFTRNVTAPMDFTPMALQGVPNIERRTSAAFELALSVLFQSGIQHYAETPRGMAQQPGYVVEFVKSIPPIWEKVRFLEGFPGKYVALARRSGDTWYIGAINAQDLPQTIELDLSRLKAGGSGYLIREEEDSWLREELPSPQVSLNLGSNQGAVLVWK